MKTQILLFALLTVYAAAPSPTLTAQEETSFGIDIEELKLQQTELRFILSTPSPTNNVKERLLPIIQQPANHLAKTRFVANFDLDPFLTQLSQEQLETRATAQCNEDTLSITFSAQGPAALDLINHQPLELFFSDNLTMTTTPRQGKITSATWWGVPISGQKLSHECSVRFFTTISPQTRTHLIKRLGLDYSDVGQGNNEYSVITDRFSGDGATFWITLHNDDDTTITLGIRGPSSSVVKRAKRIHQRLNKAA